MNLLLCVRVVRKITFIIEKKSNVRNAQQDNSSIKHLLNVKSVIPQLATTLTQSKKHARLAPKGNNTPLLPNHAGNATRLQANI